MQTPGSRSCNQVDPTFATGWLPFRAIIHCPHCGGRLEQIAVIKDRVVAKAILKSLQEATIFRPLTAVCERGPPDLPNGFENEFDQRDSW